MKIYLRNTAQGLIPVYPSDYDYKRKLKIGRDYLADIRHPRNYQFHKKFFALVNLCYENYDTEMPFDTFRRWLIMRAGFVKAFATDRGTFYDAESISFSSMDELQFEGVYNRVLNVVIKLLGLSEGEITENLLTFFDAKTYTDIF